jgi:hypothetical protein
MARLSHKWRIDYENSPTCTAGVPVYPDGQGLNGKIENHSYASENITTESPFF